MKLACSRYASFANITSFLHTQRNKKADLFQSMKRVKGRIQGYQFPILAKSLF